MTRTHDLLITKEYRAAGRKADEIEENRERLRRSLSRVSDIS